MKKFFIAIAALALVASAACTKTNPEETKSEKISFQVANYVPATKAGEVSLIDEGITSFKCKAFMVGEGVDELQNFFGTNGETITPDNTENPTQWAPSHDYYWPKSEKSYINFFSWYDTGAGPAVTNGTMKWENRTIGTGDNIMYADPAWHFQNNDHSIYNKNQVTKGVPTLFHHALSQVEFRAYATKLADTQIPVTWTIKLTGIKIGKIVNKGTLSLTATEPAATELNSKGTWNGTPAWTASTAEADKGELAPADYTVSQTENNADAAFLSNQSVLPQDLTGINLTFKLDITTNYAGKVVDGTLIGASTNHEIVEKTVALKNFVENAPAAWALNTKYIYTIKIDPTSNNNKVLFDPAIETSWDDATVEVGDKEL